MSTAMFDALAYFERLKYAGVPEPQARVQADGMRAQSEAIHTAIKIYDESRQKELATKGDLQETRLILEKDIQDTRLTLEKEIQETRLNLEKEIQDTRLNLEKEIQQVRLEIKAVEVRLLKWQIGIAVTILLVMAKGFNWLGF